MFHPDFKFYPGSPAMKLLWAKYQGLSNFAGSSGLMPRLAIFPYLLSLELALPPNATELSNYSLSDSLSVILHVHVKRFRFSLWHGKVEVGDNYQEVVLVLVSSYKLLRNLCRGRSLIVPSALRHNCRLPS
jgi:hypothetical protein